MNRPITITRKTDTGLLSAIHTASFFKGWSPAYFAESLRVEGTLALVTADKTGFALMRCSTSAAHVLLLAVLPQCRGRGIGSALLNAVLHEARLRKARTVSLRVNERSAGAREFYGRHGFLAASRQPAYYANPDGLRSAALMMEYVFANASGGNWP